MPTWIYEATLALVAAAFLAVCVILAILVAEVRKSARALEALAQETGRQMAATLRSLEGAAEELQDVGQEVRRKLDQADSLIEAADAVLSNIRFTTKLVQTKIGPPLIQAASIISGLGQGLAAFRKSKKEANDDV